MVILCMYICRGWRFVLSTLPAFQNPSHRSLTSYQSRIIRSPSLSLSSFIYRIFLYKDGNTIMMAVLSFACIQQVGKTESHNDAVARSCGAVYWVLWSGSPRSSVSPPSPPHTPSPLPFSAHLRLVHLWPRPAKTDWGMVAHTLCSRKHFREKRFGKFCRSMLPPLWQFLADGKHLCRHKLVKGCLKWLVKWKREE